LLFKVAGATGLGRGVVREGGAEDFAFGAGAPAFAAGLSTTILFTTLLALADLAMRVAAPLCCGTVVEPSQ